MFFDTCKFEYVDRNKLEMCIIFIFLLLSVFIHDSSMEAMTSSVGKTKIYYEFDNIGKKSKFTYNVLK